MPHNDSQSCACWRCWAQNNFTAVALGFIVVLALSMLVILMHEPSIPAGDITWMEGFAAGAFSSWTLALKGAVEKPHELQPGTTRVTVQDIPVVPPEPKSGTIPNEVQPKP